MKVKIIFIGVMILIVTMTAAFVWWQNRDSCPQEWDDVVFLDVQTDPGRPEHFHEGMDLETLMLRSEEYPYGFLRHKWFYLCSRHSTDAAAMEMAAFLQTLPGVTDVKIFSPLESDVVNILYKTPGCPYGSLRFYSKAYYEKYQQAL